MLVEPDKAEEEEGVVEDHIKYYRNRHILVSISDFVQPARQRT